MALVLAGALVALSLAYCVRVLQRCRGLSGAAHTEEDEEGDELEVRLAQRALALELGLGRRSVRALGRATLFAGTRVARWISHAHD